MNKLLFTALLCISTSFLSAASISMHRSKYPASYYQARAMAKARKQVRKDWFKRNRSDMEDMLRVNGILNNNFPPHSRRAIMTALAQRRSVREKGK